MTTPTSEQPTCRLTERQLDVVRLIADGLTNEQIGTRLFIEGTTVKRHVQNAITAAGARSRAHLVAIAMRAGLIP